MRARTMLNRLVNFKGFVLVNTRFVETKEDLELEVEVRPRTNSKAHCSGCGAPAPLYDRLEERRFRFPALWRIPVFLVYCMRRVDCPRCGVKVESEQNSPISYTWAPARATSSPQILTKRQLYLIHQAPVCYTYGVVSQGNFSPPALRKRLIQGVST